MINADVDEKIITYRTKIFPEDKGIIRDILESVNIFSKEEIAIALELADDRLEKGMGSDYFFLFIQQAGKTIGYACFGPIRGTLGRFDLYWIAIHNKFRGLGFGKKLLTKTESIINQMGGRRIYIETSSRQVYKPTRMFYLCCGYHKEILLKDFYSPGDSKVFYVKDISK